MALPRSVGKQVKEQEERKAFSCSVTTVPTSEKEAVGSALRGVLWSWEHLQTPNPMAGPKPGPGMLTSHVRAPQSGPDKGRPTGPHFVTQLPRASQTAPRNTSHSTTPGTTVKRVLLVSLQGILRTSGDPGGSQCGQGGKCWHGQSFLGTWNGAEGCL